MIFRVPFYTRHTDGNVSVFEPSVGGRALGEKVVKSQVSSCFKLDCSRDFWAISHFSFLALAKGEESSFQQEPVYTVCLLGEVPVQPAGIVEMVVSSAENIWQPRISNNLISNYSTSSTPRNKEEMTFY